MKAGACIVFALCVSAAFAVKGVDVSQYTDVFSCIHGKGYEFAIIRGYQSGGRVDPNVVSNIRNARSAGFKYVDVYLFPCVPCNNPSTQAQDLVNAIRGHNYGTVWVDIENYRWSSNKDSNQRFITEMVNELKRLGQTVGIYSSYYNWEEITGISWTGVSDLPLWYAHYDYSPSFSDFRSFGGWSKPAIKQYEGNQRVCGAGVDLNYYP